MTCYVLRAALSSAQYSEYRQIVVPFPISNDDYETVMKRLEAMGMGDVPAQDCRVESLDSYCPALRRLEGTLVHVDLINLTFSCQSATVITDFSDLEEIVRQHRMSLNGGCLT